MNIFQKKITKQSSLFKIYNNWFWSRKDNMSFRKARNLIRLWNKEERVDSVELINEEIEEIKNAMKELKIEKDKCFDCYNYNLGDGIEDLEYCKRCKYEGN